MILGKDIEVFNSLNTKLKSREEEISSLKVNVKVLEEELQRIVHERYDIISDCGFSIDYKGLNAISIERIAIRKDEYYKFGRECTSIGYLLDGKIQEWSFTCSRDIHKRLVQEFDEYLKTKNTEKTGAQQ